jgi:hypothetical protein
MTFITGKQTTNVDFEMNSTVAKFGFQGRSHLCQAGFDRDPEHARCASADPGRRCLPV